MIIKFEPKAYKQNIDLPVSFTIDKYTVKNGILTVYHPSFGESGLSFALDDFTEGNIFKKKSLSWLRLISFFAAMIFFLLSIAGNIVKIIKGDIQQLWLTIFFTVMAIVLVISLSIFLMRQIDAMLYGTISNLQQYGIEIFFQNEEEAKIKELKKKEEKNESE